MTPSPPARDRLDDTEILASTRALLLHSLGGDVHLGAPVHLGGDEARSSVLRIPVLDGPAHAPATVVTKVAQPDPDATSNGHALAQARARFLNERNALWFLDGLSLVPAISPRLYGADAGLRLLVLEDLGAGPSLAELLTGDDPHGAIAGLITYARTLGTLHAVTRGRDAARTAASTGAHSAPARSWAGAENWPRNLSRFVDACRALDIDLDAGFVREARQVGEAIGRPGPFLTFTISDACPDNTVVAAGSVRLFDFEFSGPGHAFLDAACLRLPFPSCWCAARLPAAAEAGAVSSYRGALITGCPEAADDRAFDVAMLSACAHWTIATVGSALERVLPADAPWGLASYRRRHVYRLEKLAADTESIGFLTSIGDISAKLARTLRTRWAADSLDVLLYPAFRSEL